MQHLRNRSILRLFVLLAALALVAAACGDDDTDDGAPSTDDTVSDDTASDDGSADDGDDAAGAGATVTIAGFDFAAPAEVTAGTEITVVNEDGVSHTWTARDGTFDTGSVGGGESTEVTLDEPGDHEFYCTIHPSMTGSITVTGGESSDDAAGKPATAPAEVVFEDQTSDGTTIVVASVTLPSPGFIAVHANDGGAPGAIIGNSDLLPAGESTDVTVTLDEPLASTDLLFPMAHIDMDSDGVYTFQPPDAAVDIPAMTTAGDIAVTGAEVTVEA